MDAVIVVACPGCALGSPGMLLAAFCVGAPFTCFVLLRPYVSSIKSAWGFPQFWLSDFVSLSLMLIWPLALARTAVEHIPRDRVLIATMLLIACTTFVWYRCLWLLQERHVKRFTRRTMFLGLTIPLLLLLGTIVGYWGWSILLGMMFGSLELIAMQSFACGLAAGPLYLASIGALKFVFGNTQAKLHAGPSASNKE